MGNDLVLVAPVTPIVSHLWGDVKDAEADEKPYGPLYRGHRNTEPASNRNMQEVDLRVLALVLKQHATDSFRVGRPVSLFHPAEK